MKILKCGKISVQFQILVHLKFFFGGILKAGGNIYCSRVELDLWKRLRVKDRSKM